MARKSELGFRLILEVNQFWYEALEEIEPFAKLQMERLHNVARNGIVAGSYGTGHDIPYEVEIRRIEEGKDNG